MMTLKEFCDFHLPALAKDEVRNNLPIAILERSLRLSRDIEFWSFDRRGHCAIRTPGRSIIVCNLDEEECRHLASETVALGHPGVAGVIPASIWFAQHMERMGVRFDEVNRMQILRLDRPPNEYPVEGHARQAAAEDADLIFQWLTAFQQEAVPHDPPATREEVENGLAHGRYFLWVAGGRPVSLAGIVRRLQRVSAIAPVYTPPELRCRGYAGAITGFLARTELEAGKENVCLYVDLAHKAPQRCYAKLGFEPCRESRHYVRSADRSA